MDAVQASVQRRFFGIEELGIYVSLERVSCVKGKSSSESPIMFENILFQAGAAIKIMRSSTRLW